MSRSVRISIFAIALLALCAAPQLRADGIDTFTYTESNGDLVASLVWQLPASPSLDSSFTGTGTGFTIGTDTGSFFLDGTFLFPFSDTFSFSDQLDGGGVNDIGGDLGSVLALSTDQLEQFYSGGADNPTFTPGTYQVINAADNPPGPGTLVISAPEPPAIILLLVGLCSMVFVAFRKRLVVV
jgi:hypothetical protein